MNEHNISILHEEIDWLEKIIYQVIATYLLQDGHENNWEDIPAPDLSANDSPYAKLVNDWQLSKYERLSIALALAPQLKPQVLDIFFGKNQLYDRSFTEFGTVTDKGHSGLLPTAQTLFFILTINDLSLYAVVTGILGRNSKLISEGLLQLSETEPYLSKYNGILSVNDRWVNYFITGELLPLEHSAEFPAQRISTNMDWEDVVLESATMEQVNEIINWIKYGDTLMDEWGLRKKIRPGYRSLFYGPPGTGKTLTATLIGKAVNKEVYKIDLSMIVSKYVGETEKNLAGIFDVAQQKQFILFFDEADSLFGKRTPEQSSNDHYANQQVSYLLQRIEDFPGIVILASNLRANMDEAFTRRFQSMIHFSMPSPSERLQLWRNAFSGTCVLDEAIDIHAIAKEYELSGGAIINVLRYCALVAISRNDTVVKQNELMAGIRKEFKKENRTVKPVV